MFLVVCMSNLSTNLKRTLNNPYDQIWKISYCRNMLRFANSRHLQPVWLEHCFFRDFVALCDIVKGNFQSMALYEIVQESWTCEQRYRCFFRLFVVANTHTTGGTQTQDWSCIQQLVRYGNTFLDTRLKHFLPLTSVRSFAMSFLARNREEELQDKHTWISTGISRGCFLLSQNLSSIEFPPKSGRWCISKWSLFRAHLWLWKTTLKYTLKHSKYKFWGLSKSAAVI